MKITFRPMTAAEFPGYREFFIADYAPEIAENYGYTLEKSLTIAANELVEDLPEHVATPGETLLCIEGNGRETIGYLWYALLDQDTPAFIKDFVLFESFRGRGYGRAALVALEEELARAGVEQIKLRVAYHNERAFGLYKKLGFGITGYNMIKILEKRGAASG